MHKIQCGHNAFQFSFCLNDALFIQQHNNPKNVVTPGGRLNKKDGLTRYGDSHVEDKTS